MRLLLNLSVLSAFTTSIAFAAYDPNFAINEPKFVNRISFPQRIDMTNGGATQITYRKFQQDFGLSINKKTTLYGPNGQFPGPTIVAKRDVPVTVTWRNRLPDSQHFLPVDETIMWERPACWGVGSGCIPVVTHLHGILTAPVHDGLATAWYTYSGSNGSDFAGSTFVYPNSQQGGALLWYHDHTLGISRLNVYAGMVGGYILRGTEELQLIANRQLPSAQYEKEFVIADRMFDSTTGELFFPAGSPDQPGLPYPTILPEFFGDVMTVNGKAWPFMPVESVKYRLRLVNGCDSRALNLVFKTSNGTELPFLQIGVDQGFLQTPVLQTSVLVLPAERIDLIIDFSGWNGDKITLTNNARYPFPDGDWTPEDDATVALVMQFKVAQRRSIDSISIPAQLLPEQFNIPQEAVRTRKLILIEETDSFGRLEPKLGTLELGALAYEDQITEVAKKGEAEIWEFINLTPDAHPIHVHATIFQVLDRAFFNVDALQIGNESSVEITSPWSPADPNETGGKDTVRAMPGQITRIKVFWNEVGEFVWHCHILSHEDHTMMRPTLITE